MSDDLGRLHLQPMVHVEDMQASERFYEQLGGRLAGGSADGDWALLEVGGAQLSLLAHPPNPEQAEGQVELNFAYVGSLEALRETLGASGVDVAPVAETFFGTQLQLTTPDGLLVKINELKPDRYS